MWMRKQCHSLWTWKWLRKGLEHVKARVNWMKWIIGIACCRKCFTTAGDNWRWKEGFLNSYFDNWVVGLNKKTMFCRKLWFCYDKIGNEIPFWSFNWNENGKESEWKVVPQKKQFQQDCNLNIITFTFEVTTTVLFLWTSRERIEGYSVSLWRTSFAFQSSIEAKGHRHDIVVAWGQW